MDTFHSQQNIVVHLLNINHLLKYCSLDFRDLFWLIEKEY